MTADAALQDTVARVSPAYRPAFPDGYRPGIGIVGCGHIVRKAHLPAYAAYGCDVVGVYDVRIEATAGVDVPVFATLDDLLGDSRVTVVDVATHPDARPGLIRRALDAGKHVLAQKPLALDVETARALVEEADRARLKLAVNQNGRWAPPWRIATVLIQAGAVGEVHSVTHLLERGFEFVLEHPHFDEIDHLLLYDHCVHWVDISRCWLDGRTVTSVQAREYRSPSQPSASRQPWGGWIAIQCADGANASIRSTGGAVAAEPGCRFWVHGSEGTIRGSILLGSDRVELERDGATTAYPCDGAWYNDGFAGAMGELVTAIAEDREPYNSARHNLLSLELTLAACRSAEQEGASVSL
jgi:predicted dehydrogenase